MHGRRGEPSSFVLGILVLITAAGLPLVVVSAALAFEPEEPPPACAARDPCAEKQAATEFWERLLGRFPMPLGEPRISKGCLSAGRSACLGLVRTLYTRTPGQPQTPILGAIEKAFREAASCRVYRAGPFAGPDEESLGRPPDCIDDSAKGFSCRCPEAEALLIDLYPVSGPQERRQILRQLGELEGDASVPFLVSLLRQAGPEERISAAQALGAKRAVEAAQALREALLADDSALLQTAARSLGFIRDRDSVLLLAGILPEAESRLQQRILVALGMIGGPGVQDHLVQAAFRGAGETKPGPRSSAIQGLGFLGAPGTAGLFLSRYRDDLEAERKLSDELGRYREQCRQRARLLYPVMGALPYLAQIDETLFSGEPVVTAASVRLIKAAQRPCEEAAARSGEIGGVRALREALLQGMCLLPDPAYLEPLSRRFEEARRRCDELAAAISGEETAVRKEKERPRPEAPADVPSREQEERRQRLDPWRKERDVLNQELAKTMVAVAYVPHPTALGFVQQVLRDHPGLFRLDTVVRLMNALRYTLGRDAFVAFLTDRLYDQSTTAFKKTIFRQVQLLHHPGMLRLAVLAMQEEDPGLVTSGMAYLGKLGTEERQRILEKLTRHPSPLIRLESARRFDPRRTPAETHAVLMRLAVDPDPEVRKYVAEALRWFCDEEAWQVCLRLVRDPEGDVRLAALVAMTDREHACSFQAGVGSLLPPDGLVDLGVRYRSRLRVLREEVATENASGCPLPPRPESATEGDEFYSWMQQVWEIRDIRSRLSCLLGAVAGQEAAPARFPDPSQLADLRSMAESISGGAQKADPAEGAAPWELAKARLRNRDSGGSWMEQELRDALLQPEIIRYLEEIYRKSVPGEAWPEFAARLYLDGGVFSTLALAFLQKQFEDRDPEDVLAGLVAKDDPELDRALSLMGWELSPALEEATRTRLNSVLSRVLSRRGWARGLSFDGRRFRMNERHGGRANRPESGPVRVWARQAAGEGNEDEILTLARELMASGSADRQQAGVALVMLRRGGPDRKIAAAAAVADWAWAADSARAEENAPRPEKPRDTSVSVVRRKTNTALQTAAVASADGSRAEASDSDRTAEIAGPVGGAGTSAAPLPHYTGHATAFVPWREVDAALQTAMWDQDIEVCLCARSALFALRQSIRTFVCESEY